MNYFCTYCDRGYSARMICLYESLMAQGEEFRLLVLCFDSETEAVISAVNSTSLSAISLAQLLEADPVYAAVRGQRSLVEFYFTSTPVLLRHCFRCEPAASQITYLDSDLYFFGPASAVFAEQGDASIGIVAHRFPPRLAVLAKCGTYNVAWVSLRRDQDGLDCLEWWRERCLEWCHDYVDQGRFADQGYLDEFPKRFRGVRVLDHPGINAAPWNMEGIRVGKEPERIIVNNRPLLFYHFQGIRELLPGWFEAGFRNYQATITPALRTLIYQPYLERLVFVQRRLKLTHGIATQLGYQRLPAGTSFRERWGRFLAHWFLPHYRRLRGQLLHCPPGEAK